jgi:hypothetical protein
MAATAPGPTNYEDVLQTGTPRIAVVSELGQPISSKSDGDQTVETFKFKDGWPIWFNAIRALTHGGGDFFTLCLWEVVGIPIEGLAFKPEELTAEVRFDANDRVLRAAAVETGGTIAYDSTRPIESQASSLASNTTYRR